MLQQLEQYVRTAYRYYQRRATQKFDLLPTILGLILAASIVQVFSLIFRLFSEQFNSVSDHFDFFYLASKIITGIFPRDLSILFEAYSFKCMEKKGEKKKAV